MAQSDANAKLFQNTLTGTPQVTVFPALWASRTWPNITLNNSWTERVVYFSFFNSSGEFELLLMCVYIIFVIKKDIGT